MTNTELISLILLGAVIGAGVTRIVCVLVGFDQRVHQFLYDRQKASMPEDLRRHMQEKFNVK